jgi:hypothetical protein
VGEMEETCGGVDYAEPQRDETVKAPGN